LRRMQGDLTVIRADVGDLKVRMSAMEQHFAILLGSLSAYTLPPISLGDRSVNSSESSTKYLICQCIKSAEML
jgi:hypothetical protein